MDLNISNPIDYSVGLYIRLSKEDQGANQSQSVVNQKSLLTSFVKKNKLNIYSNYIDDGFSGTSFERPGFIKMVEDIKAKKINMVIVKDMSRLGRDYILTGYYMEKFFPEENVRFISLLDGIDTGQENQNSDIAPFKAIINDLYAKDISKKIKSVKHDKQNKGLFIGGKAPYGYKKSTEEKNTILIDENVAPIVKRIFSLALNGISCRQIAMILNTEKVPTPSNYAGIKISHKGPYTGKWSSERITFMLKNQVYIGNMVQGRVKKVSYKSKKILKLPPEEWVVVENTHTPIVDKDTFDKVQILVNSRKSTRSRKYDYLLKGLIYCHECGYPLSVIRRDLANNKEAFYFICRTYQRFTKLRKCTCHSIKEETINTVVIDTVRKICISYIEEMKKNGTAKMLYHKNKKNVNLDEEIDIIKNKINII